MNRSKNMSQGLQIMWTYYRQNCDCVIEKITSFFFSLSSFTFKFKIDNKKVAKLRNLTAFLVKTAVLSVFPYICINESFFSNLLQFIRIMQFIFMHSSVNKITQSLLYIFFIDFMIVVVASFLKSKVDTRF